MTDLAFLPSGDMLLLERRFSYFRGVASRLRRIPAAAIAPGATVDGPVVFSADAGHQIDNMEGLAVRRDASGATVLSMISDDNF
ncbi:esterase-like activity of phytase family protein, partial [Escherichia coli]|nr:esterase-like activity of phytase family protein [Escherichia coli]